MFHRDLRRVLPLLLASMTIGLACLCSPTGLLTVPSATPDMAPTTPAFNTLPPPAQFTSGLNQAPPWLLLTTASGLWGVNPDGSGLIQFTQESFWQGHLAQALQPGGDLIAVLTSSGDQMHALTLNILSLPSGQVQARIPLTTSTTEPGSDFMPGEPSVEAARAITYNPSLSWSPDGSRLAFIGNLDGPSAEVYLYEPSSGDVRRVSTDDAQDYAPSFSPDGSRLLYFGANSFGTGAGFSMAGVWSARGDGSNVTWLYEPESSGEELIGWRDGSTAVLASWNPICGTGNLRLYNLETTHKVTLNETCFGSAAVGSYEGDPGAVLFSSPSGVFLLPSNSPDVTQVDERQAHDLRWDAPGAQFILPMIEFPMETIAPDVSWRETAPSTAEDVTAFGLIWAWTNRNGEMPGIWISGPGIELGQVFYQPAYAPAWDQDDNTLYFISTSPAGTALEALYFPAYNAPQLLRNMNQSVEELLWVGR